MTGEWDRPDPDPLPAPGTPCAGPGVRKKRKDGEEDIVRDGE